MPVSVDLNVSGSRSGTRRSAGARAGESGTTSVTVQIHESLLDLPADAALEAACQPLGAAGSGQVPRGVGNVMSFRRPTLSLAT